METDGTLIEAAADPWVAVVGVPLLAVTVLHAGAFAVATPTAAAYLSWLVVGLPGRPVMTAARAEPSRPRGYR